MSRDFKDLVMTKFPYIDKGVTNTETCLRLFLYEILVKIVTLLLKIKFYC